jgi:hypothetical protein
MATLRRRRNRDGSTSWDVTVRRLGYPTACKSFRTKLDADAWGARIEARIAGRTLTLARDMTFADLLDGALPRLRKPVSAAFGYWRRARPSALGRRHAAAIGRASRSPARRTHGRLS